MVLLFTRIACRALAGMTLLLAAGYAPHVFAESPAGGEARETAPLASPVAQTEIERLAQRILREVADRTGRTSGFCIDLSSGDGALSAALVKMGGFYVHAFSQSEASWETTRAALTATGHYGERCSLQHGEASRLPHPDYCANVIVRGDCFKNGMGELPAAEMLRVLQPGGVAIIGAPKDFSLKEARLRAWLKDAPPHEIHQLAGDGAWLAITRPMPEGMGAWSHGLHATPGNNRAADDDLVKAPFHTAWIGGPRSFTKFGIICAGEGRFVLRHGGITHTGRWKPSNKPDEITAYDGWNGTKLWTARLPEQSGRGLVAAGGVVLAPNGPGCEVLTCLDGANGEVLWTRKPAEVAAGGQAWARIACDRGIVVATVLNEVPLYTAKNGPRATQVVALSPRTGEKMWAHTSSAPLNGIAVGEERVYLNDGTKLYALDLKTGADSWTVERKLSGSILYHRGELHIDNLTFDACSGQALEGKRPRGLLAGDRVVGGGIGGVKATDRKTGAIVKVEAPVDPYSPKTAVPKGGLYGRCIPATGSTHCYFFSYSGTVIADLEDGSLFPTESFRANCRTGVIAANGLVYNSPSGCGCTFIIRGGAALLPVSRDLYNGTALLKPAPQLVKGPAFGEPAPATVHANDWPAYRGNSARNCTSSSELSTPLKHAWTAQLDAAATPPVFDGEHLIVGTRLHEIVALQASDGSVAWRVGLDGAVPAPPTCLNGRVYAGSADGWLYCLRARDGALFWKFRGAPHDRQVIVHGKPESLWPIAGGVIAEADDSGGKVWFYAGRCSHDKVYVHCLNATTGAVIWTNDRAGLAVDLTGPEGGISPHGVSPNGILAASEDVLFIPQGPRWPAGFRKTDGTLLWWNKRGDSIERSNMNIQHLGGAELAYGKGILFMGGRSNLSGHDQFFYALDATNGRIWGQDHPRFFEKVMRREDGSTILPQNYKWGIGAIKFGRGLAPAIVGDGVFVFAHYPGYYDLAAKLDTQFQANEKTKRWSIPGGSLLVSGRQAFFANGAELAARDLETGKPGWEGKLPTKEKVRKNGLATAAGRLFAITTANEVICLTAKE